MLSRISQRQLEYFVASAEAGSIISASKRIHVSSPSISAAIAHIESELGVQLFIRHHAQGLSLTPVGAQVMKEAKQILEQMANLYTISAESANEVRGLLRVGCFEVLAPMITPELMYGFVRAFPGVRLVHVEGNQETLLEKLRSAELDIIVTYDLHLGEGIAFEPLAQLPPHVIVGELHPLADRVAVTLEELSEHPMVLLDMPHSREYFLSLFMQAGITPNIMGRSANPEVVRAMVANNLGYGIMNVRPRSNFSQDGRRIVRIRLAGEYRPMRVGIATIDGLRSSRVVSAFSQRCRAFVSDQYIPGMAAASFFDPHAVAARDEAPAPDTPFRAPKGTPR